MGAVLLLLGATRRRRRAMRCRPTGARSDREYPGWRFEVFYGQEAAEVCLFVEARLRCLTTGD